MFPIRHGVPFTNIVMAVCFLEFIFDFIVYRRKLQYCVIFVLTLHCIISAFCPRCIGQMISVVSLRCIMSALLLYCTILGVSIVFIVFSAYFLSCLYSRPVCLYSFVSSLL